MRSITANSLFSFASLCAEDCNGLGVQICHLCATYLQTEPSESFANPLISLVTPTGFEPVTPRLGIWCSIQLSYGAFEVTYSRPRAIRPSCFNHACSGVIGVAGYICSAQGLLANIAGIHTRSVLTEPCRSSGDQDQLGTVRLKIGIPVNRVWLLGVKGLLRQPKSC